MSNISINDNGGCGLFLISCLLCALSAWIMFGGCSKRIRRVESGKGLYIIEIDGHEYATRWEGGITHLATCKACSQQK